MLISIIFIVIWCLLITSNIITLVELYRVKRKLNKPNGKEFAKAMGIKEKLKDADVVNVGLYNKNETSDTGAQYRVNEMIHTIREAEFLINSKENLFTQQSMQNRIDIDKAERFLNKILEECKKYNS